MPIYVGLETLPMQHGGYFAFKIIHTETWYSEFSLLKSLVAIGIDSCQ